MEKDTFKEYWDKLKKIVSKHPKGRPYDENGQFYPDPTPVAPPIGYVQEPSMFDRVREMIQRDASMRAQAAGFESFEDADDFYIEDDIEPFSPYEEILEMARPDAPPVNGELTGKDAPPPSEVPKSEPTPPAPSPGVDKPPVP